MIDREPIRTVCQCPCSCRYRLLSRKSFEVQRCFSCRHDIHYGSYMKGVEFEK